MFKNEQEDQNTCHSAHIWNKLMFLAIGGTIGAMIALLFAPKPGKEVRRDIADAAVKGYDETVEVVSRTKDLTAEYLYEAKRKGSELLEAVVEKVSDTKDEITSEAAEIGARLKDGAKRGVNASRPRQVL